VVTVSSGGVVMVETIIAKFSDNGQSYTGKRTDVEMFDVNSKVTAEMIKFANTGKRLAVQASIREAIKVKKGLKKVSTGGVTQDLSEIEEA
jgi:hypothetical protein